MSRPHPETIEELIEQENQASHDLQERIDGAWDVPEQAITEFLAMEDEIGDNAASSVLKFVTAMIEANMNQKQVVNSNSYVINVAEDFSTTPGGRYARHGPSSGEEFRISLRKMLRQAIAEGGTVVVRLDGTTGYDGSFLEEAFGGLIRKDGFSKADLERSLEIWAGSPVYRPFRDMALRFMLQAQSEVREPV